MNRRVLVRSVVFAATLAFAGAAYAQAPGEIKIARQVAGEGLAAYNAGAFEKALSLFQDARKLYPSAQILRMLGYSHLALKHWTEALEALGASLDAKITPLSADERKEVEEQIAKASSHVGSVTVTTKTPGGALKVDGGEPRALPLAKPLVLVEGPHALVVSVPGRADASSDVKVEGGKSIEVALDPAEPPRPTIVAPPPPPPPARTGASLTQTAGFVTIAAGVAFAGAAIITGLIAAHDRSVASNDAALHTMTYGNGCAMGDPRLCAYDVEVTNREGDLANKLRTTAVGLGITAGALVAAGAVLIAVPRVSQPPAASGAIAPSVRCGVAGAGLLCAGAF